MRIEGIQREGWIEYREKDGRNTGRGIKDIQVEGRVDYREKIC